MSENTNLKKEDNISTSINEEFSKPEGDEKINTSFSHSQRSNSISYNNEDGKEKVAKKVLTIANPDILNDEGKDITQESPLSKDKPSISISINSSLQNNINENSTNVSNTSPITKSSLTTESIIPSSLNSNSNKRQSSTIDNKSELDNSSVIVEIDQEEEINNVDKQINETNNEINLKKNIKLLENNRVSLATTGDSTYVNTPNDLPMPENSDIVNKNLKNLNETIPTATVPNNSVKENSDTNELDKESGDITNHHEITIIDEDEDNTCAICLIETEKPTDIKNLNGSDGTVVAPTKDEIDKFECKLHCMHKFHYSCIAQWLERNQNCPICRVDIKRFEIEAIEKRFDISIKIKDKKPLQLVQPRYNTTFEFETEVNEELVKNYMAEHFPFIHFKTYIYTRFFIFFIGYILLSLFSIVITINSFFGPKLFYAHYGIVIVVIIATIIHSILFYKDIKKNNMINHMIVTPMSSPFFYGLVIIIYVILFNSLAFLIEHKNDPLNMEKVYILSIFYFYFVMTIWSCLEGILCYKMLKEDDRRRVDAEVDRRNREILERNRLEEAEEREEFERYYSHLND